jgi:hypothetical protein
VETVVESRGRVANTKVDMRLGGCIHLVTFVCGHFYSIVCQNVGTSAESAVERDWPQSAATLVTTLRMNIHLLKMVPNQRDMYGWL